MPEEIVPAAEAREFLGGTSAVTLWRWVRDPGFPTPRRIRNRLDF
ncbi:MAG: hypothetical protein AAFS07_03260 [Pseudomonadota bacterium]